MKKVYRKNKEFKVIPENGTVLGKEPRKCISDELNEARDKDAILIEYAEDLIYAWMSCKDMMEPVVATAYCDPKDEFDEKVGLNVCEEKLDFKQHIQLAKRYSAIYRLLMETANYVYKKCETHLEKAEAINRDLIKTYGRMEL
jgi:hypothetical protein